MMDWDEFVEKVKQGEEFWVEWQFFIAEKYNDDIYIIRKSWKLESNKSILGVLVGDRFLYNNANTSLRYPNFEDWSEHMELLGNHFNKMDEILAQCFAKHITYKHPEFWIGQTKLNNTSFEYGFRYSFEYDDIQKLAMGIDNYILCTFDSFCKIEDSFDCFLNYLDGGSCYLKDLVEHCVNDEGECQDSYIQDLYDEIIDCSIIYNELWQMYFKYDDNYHAYPNRSHNGDWFGYWCDKEEKIIKDKISAFKATMVNVDYGDGYGYDRKELYELDRDSWHKGHNCSNIQSIKYKGRHIYSRDGELKLLHESPYYESIRSLIKFTHEHFDRYINSRVYMDEREESDYEIKDIELGNLVYTNTGDFGIVIGEDEVFLGDGQRCRIEDCNIIFKDNELDKALSDMKQFVINEFKLENKREIEIEEDLDLGR